MPTDDKMNETEYLHNVVTRHRESCVPGIIPCCTRCGYEPWPCETSRLAQALLAILGLVDRAKELVRVP